MCILFKTAIILFWRPSMGFKLQLGRASTLHRPVPLFYWRGLLLLVVSIFFIHPPGFASEFRAHGPFFCATPTTNEHPPGTTWKKIRHALKVKSWNLLSTSNHWTITLNIKKKKKPPQVWLNSFRKCFNPLYILRASHKYSAWQITSHWFTYIK